MASEGIHVQFSVSCKQSRHRRPHFDIFWDIVILNGKNLDEPFEICSTIPSH